MKERKTGRREQKKIASRRAILEAAVRCFIRKGFKQSSVADIMQEAELGLGTFYNYFHSKDEVLMLLLNQIMREVTDLVNSLEDEGKPVTTILGEACQRTASLLEAHPFVLSLFFSVGAHPGHPGGEKAGAARRAEEQKMPAGMAPGIKNLFIDLICRGQKQGELRTDVPPELIAELIHSIYQGAAFSRLPMPFTQNVEMKMRLLLDAVQQPKAWAPAGKRRQTGSVPGARRKSSR